MAKTFIASLDARRRRAAKPAPAPAPVAPPSGDLINAILAYADINEEIGDGLTLLRIGPRRMRDKVIAGPLGREAARLADVSVIWNEDESEIHAVLDAATPVIPGAETVDEDALFELTPLALAYLKSWNEDAPRAKAKAG
jgi:hypothetical protein